MRMLRPDRYEFISPEMAMGVKLADGKPLYSLFYAEERPSLADRQHAQDRLKELADENPDLVMRCAGKSAQEAKRILTQVIEQRFAA
jgi:hypothetical protein